ncbi:MAG: hypothetical protein SF029_10245 [bacterium]|nr:hypothetical protein [bacterium]
MNNTTLMKNWQFKLNGQVMTVTVAHDADLKTRDIRLNDVPVEARRSKINGNDYTFFIDSHFCIAQVRPTEDGFEYDLVVDGRSLEAYRQKREGGPTSTATNATRTVQSIKPSAPAAAAPQKATTPTQTAPMQTAPTQTAPTQTAPRYDWEDEETRRAMSERETLVPRKRRPVTAEERARAQREDAEARLSAGEQYLMAQRKEKAAAQPAQRMEKPPARPLTHIDTYMTTGSLYEETRQEKLERELEAEAAPVSRRQREPRKTHGVPGWTWLFIAACGALPLAFVGTVPGIVATVGAALCATASASANPSTSRRFLACLLITAVCWGAMLAWGGTLPFLA